MRVTLDDLMEDAHKRNPITVLKFDAPWCEWCQKTAPDYERATEAFAGQKDVAFLEYDVDQNRQWAKVHFKLAEIPTVIFFKDGAEVERWTADQITRDALVDKIGSLL